MNITCSPGNHQDGSSRIHEHEKNCVNFNWDMKYYVGQLVAVHIDGSICAYSMTSEFNNRLLHRDQEFILNVIFNSYKTDGCFSSQSFVYCYLCLALFF